MDCFLSSFAGCNRTNGERRERKEVVNVYYYTRYIHTAGSSTDNTLCPLLFLIDVLLLRTRRDPKDSRIYMRRRRRKKKTAADGVLSFYQAGTVRDVGHQTAQDRGPLSVRSAKKNKEFDLILEPSRHS